MFQERSRSKGIRQCRIDERLFAISLRQLKVKEWETLKSKILKTGFNELLLAMK